jgi:hypothetical protein
MTEAEAAEDILGWYGMSLGTPATAAVVMGIFVCGFCVLVLNPWGALVMVPLVSLFTFVLVFFCSWLAIFLGALLMLATSLALYKRGLHPDSILIFPFSLLFWCFTAHVFLWGVLGYAKS